MARDRPQQRPRRDGVRRDPPRERHGIARLQRHARGAVEQRRGAVAVAGVEEVEAARGVRDAAPRQRAGDGGPEQRRLRIDRPRRDLGVDGGRVGRGEERAAALLVLVGVDERRIAREQRIARTRLGLRGREPVAVEVEPRAAHPGPRRAAVGVLHGQQDDDHVGQRRVVAVGCEAGEHAQVGVGAAGLVAVHGGRQPHDRGRARGRAPPARAHGPQAPQARARPGGRHAREHRVAQRPSLAAAPGHAGADDGRGLRDRAQVAVDPRRGRRPHDGRRRRDRRAAAPRGARRQRGEDERGQRGGAPHRPGSTTSLRASPALGPTSPAASSSSPIAGPARARQSTSPEASSARARSTSARVW